MKNYYLKNQNEFDKVNSFTYKSGKVKLFYSVYTLVGDYIVQLARRIKL